MDSELRKLIVFKRQTAGIGFEQLAESSGCSVAELKGFEQNLFILGFDKLCRVIKSLEVSRAELTSELGEEAAARFLRACGTVS